MASWSAARGTRLRELDRMASLSAVFPEISFVIDKGELARLARAFSQFPGAVKAATYEATEKARRSTRNEFVRSYRALLTLKPAYIGRGIKSKKTRFAGEGAQAEIRIATSQIPLGRYGINPDLPPVQKGVAVKSRVQVRYKLRNSGKAYDDTPRSDLAPSGQRLFVQRMQSGHVGAFFRMGKGKAKLFQDWAPSLQYHAYAEGFLPHIEDFSRTKFRAAFIEEASKITGVNRS